MRRLLIISALAVSAAVISACDPKTEAPKATPTPAATATPAASPVASPAASPGKVEDKKDDKGGNSNVKPAETPKAK